MKRTPGRICIDIVLFEKDKRTIDPFILLSFSKRTIPISLQLEKEIPGAEGLLGQEAAILLEKDKRTAQNARSIYIDIYRPGILGSPFVLF